MRTLIYLVLISVVLTTCSEVDEEFSGVEIDQYANFVIQYSSQYTSTSWSANRVLGEPNVYPNYGDNSNAWSPSTENGNREFLILGFNTIQTVKTVEIYETWYPGAIDTLLIRNAETQKWERIYSKPAVTDLPAESRIFTVYIKETTYLVDAIRIAINSQEVDGWNEIDAVRIFGQRQK